MRYSTANHRISNSKLNRLGMIPCRVNKPSGDHFSHYTRFAMELYNKIIEKVNNELGSAEPKRFIYNEKNAWEDAGSNQLIMLKESAYELGGDNKPAVHLSMVTSGDYVSEDEIVVIGKDLGDISSSTAFARIALIKVSELEGEGEEDTEKLFRAIQDIDFVKYHVYPKGYMIRSSGDSFREQVRVSKEAKARGISFEKVGAAYIRRYKMNPAIEAVKLIFVTADDADFAELKKDAKKVQDITKALSKILEGMATDCHSCTLKPICDEVEGMRELHFGQNKSEFRS